MRLHSHHTVNDLNPYQTPASTNVSDRIHPNTNVRFASVVLITLGLAFLLQRTLWLIGPLFAPGIPSPSWSQSLGHLLAISLLSLQIYAGYRSWRHRIPLLGCVATFVLCVMMSDTEESAMIFSPACLGSVGVLIYTGWVSKHVPKETIQDGG